MLFIFHCRGETYRNKKRKQEIYLYNQERSSMIQESEKKPKQEDDVKHNPT